MYDLSPPATRYDEEGAALRTLSRQEDAKYISADRSSDRAKRLTASTHRAKRDRCNAFVNTLAQEFKEQTASRVFTLKRLTREKQHWFAHGEFVPSSVVQVTYPLPSRAPLCSFSICHHRTLHPTTLFVITYGRRLLRTNHQSHTHARNAGLPHVNVLRQG